MTSKIKQLRQLMDTYGIEAYIIPNTDPHQSEYIAEHWKSMTWISGFTGSAGTVVVTKDFAGLWTDSRYFLQAERQLAETGIELQKLKIPHRTEFIDWLADHLKKGDEIAVEGKVFSMSEIQRMRITFEAKGLKLVVVEDLIKVIWANRPAIPKNPIFLHDVKFTGKSRVEKLAEIRAIMAEDDIDYHLLTALDDIAWTFNIRGNDVACNPVAIAYALITPKDARLFIHPKKVSSEIRLALETDGVRLFGYKNIIHHLSTMDSKAKVRLSKNKVSHWLHKAMPKDCILVDAINIPTILKSRKNAVEIGHIRKVMEKDGAVMVRFLKWLEDNVGQISITEVSAAEKLKAFRATQPNFIGESFAAISGYKGHGAIVHYRATSETDVALQPEGIYLIDSGGQYLDGTTDITRTIALGAVPEEAKQAYTRVLKAHIALATVHFPTGTRGYELHAIAKYHLWKGGLNYGHGTGHGVGFFLNVHEGPQGMGTGAIGKAATPFEVGMLTSNEPGYYKTGEFGIRIENLVLTIPSEFSDKTQATPTFLQFETVTLCPIDTTLIDLDLLNSEEINWLNIYHQEVCTRLLPHLEAEEQVWLREKTREV